MQRLEAVEKEHNRWMERVQKYNLELQKAIGLFSKVVGPYRHLIDEARGTDLGALASALRSKDFLTYCESYDDIRLQLKDIGAPLGDLTARTQLARAIAASNCEDFKVTMKAARGNKGDYDETIKALHEDFHELRVKEDTERYLKPEYERRLKERASKREARAKTVTVVDDAVSAEKPIRRAGEPKRFAMFYSVEYLPVLQ